MSSEAIAYQKAHIDDDKRLSLIITMAVFLCAALAAAALRLMARKITNAGLKIDDWMLLVGLVCNIDTLDLLELSLAKERRTAFFSNNHEDIYNCICH